MVSVFACSYDVTGAMTTWNPELGTPIKKPLAGFFYWLVPLDALPVLVLGSLARDYHPPTISMVHFLIYPELSRRVEMACHEQEIKPARSQQAFRVEWCRSPDSNRDTRKGGGF